MAKKESKQQKDARIARETRRYNERRRRMEAWENGSGGMRKRSEDWDN